MRKMEKVLASVYKHAFNPKSYFINTSCELLEHNYILDDTTSADFAIAILQTMGFVHTNNICGFQNGDTATMLNSALNIGAFVNSDDGVYVVIVFLN